MKLTNRGISWMVLLTICLVHATACKNTDDVGNPDNETEEDKLNELTITIPPGGNSWVVNRVEENSSVITESGIHNWTELNSVIRTYFKTSTTGDLYIGLNMKVPSGTSVVRVTVGQQSEEISVSGEEYTTHYVGTFKIAEPGYHFIEIQGVSKEGTYVGDIDNILIGGEATTGETTFVKDDFYFGRRGPSVHLRYEMPENKDVQWFYNEVTVPEGEDVEGSFFMANGFGQGYFGMQVNSESERRILFSVWSPYNTQNPDDIPDEYKIILLGKGNDVVTGEFGNEGSGGQSYLRHNWQAGNTYQFLLKGEPSNNNSTDFTAYFFAPEAGEWKLIASFRRPFTSTYLTDLHSFLENFKPETGFISRRGQYANQWVYDTEGTWHEMNKATFTADATARSGARLDYAGGADSDIFFMQNCGFFDENTAVDTDHERAISGNLPAVDFSQLEVPSLPELPTYLDKTNWQVVGFSSEETVGEGDNGRASLLIDRDNSTYWHSCWSTCDQTYGYPHEIVVDMAQPYQADGFSFVQRNGSRKVEDIEILISNDNSQWESLGNFVLEQTASVQDVALPESKTFRYFKVVFNAAHDEERFASMAEIGIFAR
ncbi:DUF3472 domain-containing protein [Tunicatimonas pelagia]|uniref:DUF3472 domain-containing protein n=1 Tax=Tunicatimonas pelagia TaxID=931531 RepID=UPI002666B19D|nr:DUF3472 domain-containing protein [Tunicatimonas pelagia]WKN44193.1 DUF3472 domain-containing protein [Tunicatimonas pelagia]